MKKLHPASKTRRQFLKHMCKASLLPSALKASVAGTGLAWAGSVFAAEPVRRFVAIHVTNGAPAEDFMVSSLDQLPYAAEPYRDYVNDMIFCNNLTMLNSGHGHPHRSLQAGKSTVDMVYADMVGPLTSFSSIQLGVHSSSTMSRFQKVILPHETNPITAFTRLFAGGGSALTDINTRRKLALLDESRNMHNEFRNKLGSYQKERFDSHLEAIEKVESRINKAAEQNIDASCKSPAWNGSLVSGIPDNVRTHAELQMEIIALALKCDLTRTASLSFCGVQAGIVIPEIEEGVTLHNSCHGGNKGRAFNKHFRRWFSEQHAYLMNDLRRYKDSDGSSILDNTIGVLVSDMGDGRNHAGGNAPFAFFGGGAGRLQRGKVIVGGDSADFAATAASAAGVTEHDSYEGSGGQVLNGVLA